MDKLSVKIDSREFGFGELVSHLANYRKVGKRFLPVSGEVIEPVAVTGSGLVPVAPVNADILRIKRQGVTYLLR